MKKILISFALMSNICCMASETYLKPLWLEDSHFCQYRTLCIEGSVCRIEKLVEEARNNPGNIEDLLDFIDVEVINCKNALGWPSN